MYEFAGGTNEGSGGWRMTEKTPKVSVIIPTYNRAHLVAGRSGLCSTRPTRILRSLWWTTAIGTVYDGGIGNE